MTTVFVDHSFHELTGSSRFFEEILARDGPVERLWDHRWKGGKSPEIPLPDSRLIYWQSDPPPQGLLKHRGPVIWVPMYGDCSRLRIANAGLPGASIIAFSERISDWCARGGYRCLRVQYFVPPVEPRASTQPRVFFWDRGDVTWSEVKTLLGPTFSGEVVYRMLIDPDFDAAEGPSKADRVRYRIEWHEGEMASEEYLKLLETCTIFVAPRTVEGIGMSFLEAMARGLAVIAPDRPTMNEYITHGENGYLVKWPPCCPLDLSDFASVGRRAFATVEEGYSRWQEQHEAILDFIAQAKPPTTSQWIAGLLRLPVSAATPLVSRLRAIVGRCYRRLLPKSAT